MNQGRAGGKGEGFLCGNPVMFKIFGFRPKGKGTETQRKPEKKRGEKENHESEKAEEALLSTYGRKSPDPDEGRTTFRPIKKERQGEISEGNVQSGIKERGEVVSDGKGSTVVGKKVITPTCRGREKKVHDEGRVTDENITISQECKAAASKGSCRTGNGTLPINRKTSTGEGELRRASKIPGL